MMPRFALINTTDNSLIELRSYATQPPDPAGKPRKWLPCDPVAQPSFDPTIEKILGPTYTVGTTSVTEVWAKTSLTAQEISDAKDSAIAGSFGGIIPVVAQVMLNHENRIRALEGKAAITMT